MSIYLEFKGLPVLAAPDIALTGKDFYTKNGLFSVIIFFFSRINCQAE
jgi:hypothetical protein